MKGPPCDGLVVLGVQKVAAGKRGVSGLVSFSRLVLLVLQLRRKMMMEWVSLGFPWLEDRGSGDTGNLCDRDVGNAGYVGGTAKLKVGGCLSLG